MGKSIYISTLVFIIAIFIALPFIKIPISTSARGVVRAYQENTPVSVMLGGRIKVNRLNKNNQKINKGDTLLVITKEVLETQKQFQQSQNIDYNIQLRDLDRLSRGIYTGLETGQYQREVSAMREQEAQVKSQLDLSKKELDRANLLFSQGVIAKSEHEKIYYTHQELQRRLKSIREQQMAQWQAQKKEIQRQIKTISSEIQKIKKEEDNYIVTAPISGRLVGFSGIYEGNFVSQGAKIAEISPEERFIVECLIPSSDIGFIYLNQDVKFQVDTYNYNQWGLLNGKVEEIDQNITIDQQGNAYFKVICSMNKSYLELKNGYKGNIGKGMTLTARFHLTDRTLWQLLFDRVDDWFNPKLKND